MEILGVIKFLDAHCGTILTICIIVVGVAIVTHFRLKKVSWEFENERQKFRDKYKPIPIVRLRSPESDMLHRVFHMCREMIITLRRFEERKDWQMEKGFGFFNCSDIIAAYNDTYDKTKKYGINGEFWARAEEKGLGVFVDFMWDDKTRFKDGEESRINFRIYRYLLLTPELIEELDRRRIDPTQKLKDDVFLSALKDAVRNKYKKI